MMGIRITPGSRPSWLQSDNANEATQRQQQSKTEKLKRRVQTANKRLSPKQRR